MSVLSYVYMYVYAFLVHTRPLLEEDDGQEDFIEEGGLVMDCDSYGGGDDGAEYNRDNGDYVTVLKGMTMETTGKLTLQLLRIKCGHVVPVLPVMAGVAFSYFL